MAQQDVRFDDRVVLVTGAARGLGRSHALLLASRGAKVVIADNGVAMDGSGGSAGLAEDVVAEITASGGVAAAFCADLANEEGAVAAVRTTIDQFGRIDGLLHNATTVPDLVAADLLASKAIDSVLQINLAAGLWLVRAAWPHMVNQNYGRIVFTTSAAIYGAEGNAPYAAAKAGCIGIAKCLAPEGARHGICVNVIAPSAKTRTTEGVLEAAYADWLFRTMPADKVSIGAAYLMSEECAISGEIIAMGGGRFARIRFAEGEGVMGPGASIEEVRDAMPFLMADNAEFFPKDLTERSARVAALFGYPNR